MANAKRDENNVPTMLGVSSADGSTPILPYVNPTTHRVLVDFGYASVNATWAADGNTCTITDANCAATSFVMIMHTNVPNGIWCVTPASGSFVITSSDSEAVGLTFTYKIFPQ